MSAPSGGDALYSSDEQLAVTASQLYFIAGHSKMEVAAEMGLSRFKVARLLDLARDRGIVEITITPPSQLDLQLGDRLCAAFGLSRAVVISTEGVDEAVMRTRLGRRAADLLTELVVADDVLGIGWARSVLSMAEHLTRLARCDVVQLTGALSRPGSELSAIEVVRQIAALSGGRGHFFYAPMLTSESRAASAMRAETDLAAAIGVFPSVTKAVVGIGGWHPPASVLYDAMTPSDRAQVLADGAFADLSGVLLTAAGRPVVTKVSRRIIGIDAKTLAAIPEVIAIAYGKNKVTAARAALQGRFISSLVTHSSFAEKLLSLA